MNAAVLQQQFLSAFAKAWSAMVATTASSERIIEAYAEETSWSQFLFAKDSGFFYRVKESLTELGGQRIEVARPEDCKLDMSFVGGSQCFGTSGGWGYASRQLVLIEHENRIQRTDEEFYKLLFRIADLKVLAFPEWAASKKTEMDPLREMIQRFSYLAKVTAGHGQSDNILVLVSGRDSQHEIPRWRYLIPPWTKDATPQTLSV